MSKAANTQETELVKQVDSNLIATMETVFQFGFLCAEKGMNLQMAMEHFNQTMKPK